MLYLQHINALDLQADALIYSTNIMLNCTGGMGADLVDRYGLGFQEELHGVLARRGTRFARQGEVIDLTPAGLPFRKVLHTLPCDPMYETSEEIVSDVVRKALKICSESGNIKTVSMTALATGYGRMLFDDFLRLIDSVILPREGPRPDFSPVQRVTLCVRDDYTFELAVKQIKDEGLGIEVEVEKADTGA